MASHASIGHGQVEALRKTEVDSPVATRVTNSCHMQSHPSARISEL